MKAIMISIKPKWVAKILNGEKTIEIRKSCPEIFKRLKPYEGCSIDVYIYCTKSDYFGYISKRYIGKVVAKFTLNICQEWHNYSWQEITKNGCISDDELRNYCKGHKSLYIWHISNLKIFEPKELSEFKHLVKGNKLDHSIDAINYVGGLPLTKAPESWCYVEVE